MTATSTLILVIIGMVFLSWISTISDAPERGSLMVTVRGVIVRLLAWALIIGGCSGGIILILYAFTSDDGGGGYGGFVGLFGLLLLGVTLAFTVAIRSFRHLR